MYHDIYDAKNAVDHLSGFNVAGRYLVVIYYQASRKYKDADPEVAAKQISDLKNAFGLAK